MVPHVAVSVTSGTNVWLLASCFCLASLVLASLPPYYGCRWVPGAMTSRDCGFQDRSRTPSDLCIIIIIIIRMIMFMVLSSWQATSRVHPVHIISMKWRQAAADPQTRPNDPGCESACRLPEAIATITIYYYYSAWKLIFILPSHGA